MTHKSDQLVGHLFRTEYGKLVAVLTRIFGPARLQLAEDIVQDTLITALNHWSVEEIPLNPTGWLMQVAKRKALNELKRGKMMQEHHSSGFLSEQSTSEIDNVFLSEEIEDSQLRMIFTCCHPALSTESQIALTLKTLCGFGVKEVANALLTTESTINKRLYRAKTNIRELEVHFQIPQGEDLKRSLDTVMLTLYLLFNEGYNSTSSDEVIQKDLCLEAIRLTKLLVDHFEDNQKLYALLSLMCFHAARFDARIDDHGAIILFEDQDRSLWNSELINLGTRYLKRSMGEGAPSAYHLEAGIAAEHCLAESFDTTDWKSIYDRYVLLEKLKPNPIIKLNLAIIQRKLSGVKTSLAMLEQLTENESLKNYHLLSATLGTFHFEDGNKEMAKSYFQKAMGQTKSKTEIDYLSRLIDACS